LPRTRRPLVPGDLIAIVAPSGPVPAERYARGAELLRGLGFRVRDEGVIRTPHRYLAASDAERAAQLDAAFADPEVRAIFVGRGGYGAMRLLPALALARAAASDKLLVGFSDVTALHLALFAQGGASVHGPVVVRLGEEPPASIDRLFALLAGKPVAPIPGNTVVPGSAEGPLVGGCLSLTSRLFGTPYLPSLKGCILLIEEVDERPYRIDRMWTHLKLAGVLDGLAGIAIGELTGCDEPDAGYTAQQVLDELVAALGKPAIAGLPIGHGKTNLAVPHGVRVAIDGGALHVRGGLFS
jgi:muramoyltetrapeptide carboxypeptidase